MGTQVLAPENSLASSTQNCPSYQAVRKHQGQGRRVTSSVMPSVSGLQQGALVLYVQLRLVIYTDAHVFSDSSKWDFYLVITTAPSAALLSLELCACWVHIFPQNNKPGLQTDSSVLFCLVLFFLSV